MVIFSFIWVRSPVQKEMNVVEVSNVDGISERCPSIIVPGVGTCSMIQAKFERSNVVFFSSYVMQRSFPVEIATIGVGSSLN